LYLDPPYVANGSTLYENAYALDDHEHVAAIVQGIRRPWVVTYDYDPMLLRLYRGRRRIVYSLSYHAQTRYRGSEIMFFSDDLDVPRVTTPTHITRKQLRSYQV
jgi:DNA adenine methylase